MTEQECEVVLEESGWRMIPNLNQWFWVYSEGDRNTKEYRELSLGWSRGRCMVYYWVDANKLGVRKALRQKLGELRWDGVETVFDVVDRSANKGHVCNFYINEINEDNFYANRRKVYDRVNEIKQWFANNRFLSDEFLRNLPTDAIASTPCSDNSGASVVKEESVDNVLTPVADPFAGNRRAAVVTVEQLLRMNLRIPSYQRPYKWTRRNVEELLGDIKDSLDVHESDLEDASPLKYRLGTVIVDGSRGDGKLDVVDGQQRILTLLLINRAIESIRKNKFECPILNDAETLRLLAANVVSRRNLHENYAVVKSVLAKDYDLRRRIVLALGSTLEMVMIRVDKVAEAFQVFDSQNTRGRPLDPHDLLKAHHLRAMAKDKWWLDYDGGTIGDQISKVVQEWETHSPAELRELFDRWLFRIGNWMQKRKTHQFGASDIQTFKGVPHCSPYSFASRARAAMPNSDDEDQCRQFQIGADFVEGRGFFRMVAYYLRLVKEIKKGTWIENLDEINGVIKADDGSTGFDKTLSLFQCALLCCVDRFGGDVLQDRRVMDKLCLWAFMLRLNMAHVTEDTINRYAVIEGGADYTNTIPLFAMIKAARSPGELAIADVYGLNSSRHKRKDGEKNRKKLVAALKALEA